tara:strand:+ start:775 stop:1038 length:264 start_codon:yes stop_codon:yes gene_type:complete
MLRYFNIGRMTEAEMLVSLDQQHRAGVSKQDLRRACARLCADNRQIDVVDFETYDTIRIATADEAVKYMETTEDHLIMPDGRKVYLA